MHRARDLDRELEIVVRRYGLDGKPSASLKALADDRGLGRERIRQLENLGLATIRRSTAYEGLRRLEDLAAPAIIAHLGLDEPLERKVQIRRLRQLPPPVGFLIAVADRSEGKWAERRLPNVVYDFVSLPRNPAHKPRR